MPSFTYVGSYDHVCPCHHACPPLSLQIILDLLIILDQSLLEAAAGPPLWLSFLPGPPSDRRAGQSPIYLAVAGYLHSWEKGLWQSGSPTYLNDGSGWVSNLRGWGCPTPYPEQNGIHITTLRSIVLRTWSVIKQTVTFYVKYKREHLCGKNAGNSTFVGMWSLLFWSTKFLPMNF